MEIERSNRERTPENALVGEDGTVTFIHARNVKYRPRRSFIAFIATLSTVGAVLIASLGLLIWIRDPTDPLFQVFLGLFTLSFGILVPNPDYGQTLVEGARRERAEKTINQQHRPNAKASVVVMQSKSREPTPADSIFNQRSDSESVELRQVVVGK